MTKRTIINAAKYLLPVALLSYLAWHNWSPKFDENGLAISPGFVDFLHKPIHGGPLLLATVIGMASLLLTLGRWYILVRAVNLPFRLIDALRLGLVGFFYNMFLPGSVGGDIIKAAFLAREQNRRTVAVATVIMDRAIALWALTWFVLLAGSIFWAGGLLAQLEEGAAHKCEFIIEVAAGIVAVSLVAWIALGFLPPHRAERFAGRLSRLPRVGVSAAEFWRAVWMYRSKPKSVATAMGLSWIGHVGFVLSFYFAVLSVWDAGDPTQKIPPWTVHFLIVPIGLVVQAGVPFPGGLGIGEAFFGGMYLWLDCCKENGMSGSFVQRMIFWALGAAGYLFYLRMRPTLQPAPKMTEERAAVDCDGVTEPRSIQYTGSCPSTGE